MHHNGQQNPEDTLFEAVAELGKLLGLNKSAALALAILFAADNPLSLDEVTDNTGIAKSSNSVILKQLEQMGLIEAVHQPRDRRKYYQVVESPGERFAMLIAQRLSNVTSRQQDLFDLDCANHSAQFVDRVYQLQIIYQGLQQTATFLRTWRADAWEAFDERLSDHSSHTHHDTAHTRR